MDKRAEKQNILLCYELISIQIAHQPTHFQKNINFPAVFYNIDRKVQKLVFKFVVGWHLVNELDASKQKAALRALNMLHYCSSKRPATGIVVDVALFLTGFHISNNLFWYPLSSG